MILSHHGELEYGSPKVPLFAEAMLLHHIDNMDSKIECMRSVIEKDRMIDSCWTSYVSSLDRSVLKKKKYLEEAPPAVPAVAAQTVAAVQTVPSQPTPQQQQAAVASASPAPAKPQQQQSPFSRATSIFGEKLKGALGKDS
jgi:3'-5' exoribonuclease